MKIDPAHYSMYSNDLIFPAYCSSFFGKTVSTGKIGEVNENFILDFLKTYECKIDHEVFEIAFVKDKSGQTQKNTERSFYYIEKQRAFLYYYVQHELNETKRYVRFYSPDTVNINNLSSFAKAYKIFKKSEENQISLIIYQDKSLGVHDFKIKIGEIDIPLNYGSAFEPKFNKIMQKLNEPEGKGIVLLHGKPGTGKTSLIKYIAKNLKKRVLFIPPAMAQSLSDPEFIYFLLDYPNSILIIEDAEKVVSSRDSMSSSQSGVANILNISDGILGDCLNIQIIASFNTDRNNIDSALMRKGRLIVEHEFGPLSIQDSSKLLVSLNKTPEAAKKPMTLTEIYNYEEQEFKSTGERAAVGFTY